METEELKKKLKEKAEAVQAVTVEVRTLEEALRYAVELTAKQGGKTIAAPGLTKKDRSTLAKLCDDKGITVLTGNLKQHADSLHTGFTTVDWGIAETATMVLNSTLEDIRIATTLVETHIAVLPLSRLRSTATELEPELTRMMKTQPSYTAFISGASRTADIERVLTIGVHGPQEFHILILEDKKL